MKKLTVALALLLAMLSVFVLGSCAEPDVKTKVNIKFVVGDQELYAGDVTVKSSPDSTTGPAVIDAVKTLMDSSDYVIELDSKTNALAKFGMYYETTYDGVTYAWSLTVNEKDASTADTYLKDGDQIVYTFMMMVPDGNGSVKYEPVDPNNNVFLDELAGNDDPSSAAE